MFCRDNMVSRVADLAGFSYPISNFGRMSTSAGQKVTMMIVANITTK
jgi:hypothetical protein